MKKLMLIGETRVGKSSIIRSLSDGKYTSHRAMAVEYHGQFINTPGEFLENHRFYTALITASADADIIAMVVDATRTSSLFPPNSATVFNKPVIGIINKIDMQTANIMLAQRFLKNAGAKAIICTSTVSGAGMAELQEIIV